MKYEGQTKPIIEKQKTKAISKPIVKNINVFSNILK
jgi:hypothetical protein